MDTKTSEAKKAYGRQYWQNLTPEQRAHKTAVRHAYFANMSHEKRARIQGLQVQWLRNLAPEKREQRMSYQRNKMRQKRLDSTYMDGFKKYHTAWRTSAKEQCINMYSNGDACCAHCQNADIDVLCLDHIENNGQAHRRSITKHSGGASSGSLFYARLRTLGYPPGLQVLCANCNLKKEILRRRTRVRS